MYFIASEYLLRDGIAGKAMIEAVDAFLGDGDRRPDDLYTADLIGQHLGLDSHEVGLVLEAFGLRGVLVRREMVTCPEGSCRTLNPIDEVREAREDGDPRLCDGCEFDLAALESLQTSAAYQLVAIPDP